MGKHTPGPWHIGMRPGPIVYGEQGEQVASLFVPLVPEEENKANAALIAAAPELLAALEKYDYWITTLAIGSWRGDLQKTLKHIREDCRAAIRKARGEE